MDRKGLTIVFLLLGVTLIVLGLNKNLLNAIDAGRRVKTAQKSNRQGRR